MGPPNSVDSTPTLVQLDDAARLVDNGQTVIGGSPLRLLKLTAAGARLIERLERGDPVPARPAPRGLVRRLLAAGVVHPRPRRVAHPRPVSLVIPVLDDPTGLGRTLAATVGEVDEIVVVDDGSADQTAIDEVLADHPQVVLCRHETTGGPAAARNTGWREASHDTIAFCDADVVPRSGWIMWLLGHFDDETVGAVAPRVRSVDGDSLLGRYERQRSPLDLGDRPARVAPRTRVAYVPTATLVARRAALEEVGGFDPGLRFGEDVDFVWRLTEAAWTVRYEPAAVVEHTNRPSWPAMARQRMSYGSSAASLDQRHPGSVAPVELNAWSAATWALLAFGGRRTRVLGLLVGWGSVAGLVPKLRDRVDQPVVESLRLAGLGHLWAGHWLAQAMRRAWLPLAVGASVLSGRARRLLVGVAMVPPLVDWVRDRPPVDPVRWVACCLVDDASYCVGVWKGCAAARRWSALLPRFPGIEGLLGGSGEQG